MACGDFRDRDSARCFVFSISDRECHGRTTFLGVCGGVARCRIYRLEAEDDVVSMCSKIEPSARSLLSQVISEVCNGVVGIADQLYFRLSSVILFTIDVR